MYPRTNYEMTEDDLRELMKACAPTIVIKVGNYVPASPQENANQAWKALGEKYGFDSMTVQPTNGKGDRFFTAVPSENEIQKEDRLAREAREKREARAMELRGEIDEREKELSQLVLIRTLER